MSDTTTGQAYQQRYMQSDNETPLLWTIHVVKSKRKENNNKQQQQPIIVSFNPTLVKRPVT